MVSSQAAAAAAATEQPRDCRRIGWMVGDGMVRELSRQLAWRRSSRRYMTLLGRRRGRKHKDRESSGQPIWVVQLVGALLSMGGRWRQALAMRQVDPEAAAATADYS